MSVQRILAEVVLQIPKYRVNMVGAALRVVVFDQDSGTLDAVIMALSGMQSAGPGKMKILEAGIPDFFLLVFGQVASKIVRINKD